MAGKDIKGLIVEETGDSLKLINNPSAPDNHGADNGHRRMHPE
jgi:hypothetical protein